MRLFWTHFFILMFTGFSLAQTDNRQKLPRKKNVTEKKSSKTQAEDAFRPKMIFIKGGTYTMGDSFDEGIGADTTMKKQVSVDDFYMSNYEITFAEFDTFCMQTNWEKPSSYLSPGRGHYPVVNVSWYEAIAYCNWRSQRDLLEPCYQIDTKDTLLQSLWSFTLDENKNGYRLPTEAEWEYAAREGGKKCRFGNGKNTCDITEINYYFSTILEREPYEVFYETLPAFIKKNESRAVFQMSPNSLGLHCMSGNVKEWCADIHNVERNHPENIDEYIWVDAASLRGGSFLYGPVACIVTDRSFALAMDHASLDIGFRIVRNAK